MGQTEQLLGGNIAAQRVGIAVVAPSHGCHTFLDLNRREVAVGGLGGSLEQHQPLAIGHRYKLDHRLTAIPRDLVAGHTPHALRQCSGRQRFRLVPKFRLREPRYMPCLIGVIGKHGFRVLPMVDRARRCEPVCQPA